MPALGVGVILCSCPCVTHTHPHPSLSPAHGQEPRRACSLQTHSSFSTLAFGLSLSLSLSVATCELRRRSVQDLPAAFPGETGQVRSSPPSVLLDVQTKGLLGDIMCVFVLFFLGGVCFCFFVFSFQFSFKPLGPSWSREIQAIPQEHA